MKYLRIIIIAVTAFIISMLAVSPALAQVDLPYTTSIIVNDGKTVSTVGELTVYANGTVIFQIDTASTDWRLTDTRLYVGDTPPSKIKPENYPYQHTALGGTDSDEYYVDIYSIDLNADGIVYVAANVELSRLNRVNKNGKSFFDTATGWALGDESSGSGNNYKTFFGTAFNVVHG